MKLRKPALLATGSLTAARAVLDDLAASTQAQEAVSPAQPAGGHGAARQRAAQRDRSHPQYRFLSSKSLTRRCRPFSTTPFWAGYTIPTAAWRSSQLRLPTRPTIQPRRCATIAHSCGNTATLASLLGTLLGAWYGAERLSALHNFQAELDIVETNLTELFPLRPGPARSDFFAPPLELIRLSAPKVNDDDHLIRKRSSFTFTEGVAGDGVIDRIQTVAQLAFVEAHADLFQHADSKPYSARPYWP